MDITLDTRDKFFAVLEALQQFIDNCEDADGLIEESRADEFYARLEAAEEIRDQLDATLASLADS